MFGFLSQIPAFLGKGAQAIGGGIAKGAQTAGKGILGGIRKTVDATMKQRGGDGEGMMLPSAQMPGPAPTSVLTPGINPGARMPDISGAGTRQMPPITGVNMPSRSMPVGVTPPIMTEATAPEVSMQTQVPMREMPQVRVPQLPGRTGPPLEDSPYNRARYEYVTRNMNEQGEIPRSWKTIGRSALTGIAKTYQQNPNAPWQAQLAGGAAGGIGAAINPAGGEEFVFDSMYAPGVEKDQQRSQEVEQRENERIRREQDVLMGRARIGQIEAQTDATRAGMKDADVERRYRESQIKANEARAQAAITGRPQVIEEFDRETGAIRKVAVYADGRKVDLGESGNAQLRREGYMNQSGIAEGNRESREGIASADRASREQIAYDKLNAQPQMSRDAREAYGDYLENKRAAEQLWAVAKRETDPQKKKELEQAAREAQEMFNYQTQSLGQLFPELFESGMGQGGWAYAKPKGDSRQPTRQMGGTTAVSRAAVEGYAQEKGISYDEALKRFQAKGIQVRK